MIRGERVQLSGIGTLIPEVKTRMTFNLPICNKEDGNPPYTRLRMTRIDQLGAQMNQKLTENVNQLCKNPIAKRFSMDFCIVTVRVLNSYDEFIGGI